MTTINNTLDDDDHTGYLLGVDPKDIKPDEGVYGHDDDDHDNTGSRFAKLWNVSDCTDRCSIVCRILECILSFMEIVLASLWVHTLGIVVGCVVFVYSCGWLWSMIYRGPLKLSILTRVVRFLVRATLFVFIFLLVLVHLAALDPSWNKFPSGCRQFQGMDNCARLANGTAKAPPHFATDRTYVANMIHSYLDDLSRTTILHRANTHHHTFMHARVISLIMGYPDDFAVLVFCENGGTTVYVQSQSRLGKSDSGVNKKRVDAFVNALNAHTFPVATCTN